MSELSTSLYWSLPSPTAFSHKVTDAARVARALILSFPQYMPSSPIRSTELERALKNANINDPITLNISEGMPISVEIGTHFNVSNMPAQALAHHTHGAQHAVILHALNKRAQEHCERYVSEFVNSLEDAVGDVRLIIAITSGEHKEDAAINGIRVIAFDGGLQASEIEAYVAMRMISYTGPGSTNLYKHLVTEYASFDPVLAEHLSKMEPSSLMNLPNSLSEMVSEDILRWARHSWVDGTISFASKEVHPLREWYVATHSGAERDAMRRASERRYWKACLKALIPWLEERRYRVLDILDRQLRQIELAAGGPDKIQKKVGSNFIQVTRNELEYSDIVFQSRRPEFNRIPMSPQESTAISICSLAKDVRDDISHLRPPKVNEIMSLITTMDSLLP